MEKEYLTIKETAAELGLEDQTVRSYIYLGRLKSEKKYNSTVVAREEVERYIKEVQEVI